MVLVGGLMGYLWMASESIEAELREQRPQITVKVKLEPPKSDQAGLGAGDEGKTAERATLGKKEVIASEQRAKVVDKPEETGQAEIERPQKSAATAGAADAGVVLHPHPDLKLIEETDQGPLPRIDEEGRQPWRVYSRPFDEMDTRSRIAIVVTHLGLAPQQTQDAIVKLPSEVTLGFAPYARGLNDWVQQARDNGHEVLIGLPMEPSDYPRNDPGPNGLMLANSQEENIKRLNWVLSRATGYVGVFDFMGSRFTAEEQSLKPILEQLKNRGLMMLDTRDSSLSTMGAVAQDLRLPYSAVDIAPDLEPNRGSIDRQLKKLSELARTEKYSVAIVRPLPITMLRLRRWIERLDSRKFVLAPISAVVGPFKAQKPPKF